MPTQHCATCGREFEGNFGDSPASLNCPECDERLALRSHPGIATSGPARLSSSFLITTGLIALNAMVFLVMVL
jgi:DNA-directed RNA polymerase subunit RPC12/RpoP